MCDYLILTNLQEYVRQIKLKPFMKQIYDIPNVNWNKVVGIHIQKFSITNIVDDIISIINDINVVTNIVDDMYIACDECLEWKNIFQLNVINNNLQLKKQFYSKYNGTIDVPKAIVNDTDKELFESFQLQDMYCLSLCGYIIKPKDSTFSKISEYWSNATIFEY